MTLTLKTFAVLFLIFILFITLSYLLIPYIFNINQIKLSITHELEKSTNRKVSISSISPFFGIGPGIKLEGLKIYEENGKDIFLHVDSLSVGIRITSLFFGKFDPKNIIIKNPEIIIKRNENGVFNIKTVIEALHKTKRDPKLLSKILLRNILIKKGKISFNDFFKLKNPLESQYEELDVKINNFSFVKPVRFSFQSSFPNEKEGRSSVRFQGIIDQIPIDFDPGKIRITAELDINSFNLIQFFYYFKNLLPFSNLDGITDIKAEYSGNLLGNFALKGDIRFNALMVAYSKFYSRPIQSNSGSLMFELKSDKDLIDVKNYQLRMDNLVLNGFLSIKNPKTEIKSIDFKISSNIVPYNFAKKYLPEKIMPHTVLTFLTEKLKGGELMVNSLRFEGKTEDFKNKKYSENPNLITLDADLKNGDMLLGNNLSPIKIINGNVAMKNGELIFSKSNGYFGKSPFQLISGKILSLYKFPELVLNLKGDARIFEITEFFKAGFIPKSVADEAEKIQSPDGSAGLTLSIEKLLKEKTPFNYSGELTLNGGGFTYQKLNYPFYDLNGIVKFNREEININNFAVKTNDSNLSLNGKIKNYTKDSSSLFLSLEGNISSAVINPLLGKNSEKIKPEGFLKLDIKAEGETLNPNFAGKIDLSEIGYRVGKGFTKDKFYPNKLSIEGKLLQNNSLHIDKSTITLGKNELTATGDISDFKNISLDIFLKSTGFDLKEGQQSFPFLLTHDTMGKILGEIKITGRIADLKELSLLPNIDLEDVTFKIGNFLQPLKKISGNFTFDKGSLIFLNTGITLGKSRLVLNGRISDFKNPKSAFDIKSSSLNLNDLFTKETEDKDKPEGFKFSNIELSDLSGSIDYNNGMISIENLKAKCWNGDILFKGVFDSSRKNEFRFLFSNETKNNSIKKFFNYLGIKNSDVQGKVDINGNLGSLGKNGEEIKKNLNGNISIESKNGKIKKTGLGILSRVLAFFNVFKWHEFWIKDVQVNGMPYKSLKGDFLIKDGIVYTENLFLDGNAMKISAVGNIDILKGTIDMKLGVQPLSTVDTIVSNIPVIGYILGGKNKSFVIAHFNVTGDIKNPKVESIPIQSLGKGILGIFKRIFTYPEHILSPENNN